MTAEFKSLNGQTDENNNWFFKQQNLKTTRVEWIDIAKGIGIFLVVLCHLTSLFEEQIWNVFIFSFHMPLFFFLSGLVFSNKKSFKSFFTKKLRSIYIPYFAFVSFDFFVYSITNFATMNIKDVIVSYGMHLLGFDLTKSVYFFNVPIWFLFVLFIAELLLYFISKTNIYVVFCVVLGCCAWICFIDIKLPFSLNQVLAALIFVSLGYIIKNTKLFIQEINDRKSRIIYGIIGIVLFIILLLSNYFFGNKISMEKFIFGNVALFLVNAIIGIFMVVFISMAIEKIKSYVTMVRIQLLYYVSIITFAEKSYHCYLVTLALAIKYFIIFGLKYSYL